MAYAILADIEAQLSEDELIQLTDDAGEGEVDESIVARAIVDADEEMDGYLGGRMEVPLYPVPGIVRKLSVDIAIYNLYSRRPGTPPDVRSKRYDNAVRFLVRVGEGKLSLGQDDPAGAPPESGGVSYSACDQVMTSTKLDRF